MIVSTSCAPIWATEAPASKSGSGAATTSSSVSTPSGTRAPPAKPVVGSTTITCSRFGSSLRASITLSRNCCSVMIMRAPASLTT